MTENTAPETPETPETEEEAGIREANERLMREAMGAGVRFLREGLIVRITADEIHVLNADHFWNDSEMVADLAFGRPLYMGIDMGDDDMLGAHTENLIALAVAAIRRGAEGGREEGREDMRVILRGLLGIEATMRITG